MLRGSVRILRYCCVPLLCEKDYLAWPAINRKAIGALASVGALESAYLTYQKIHPAGLDLLCGASGGCLDVLNGPYSNVLVRGPAMGVPLVVVFFLVCVRESPAPAPRADRRETRRTVRPIFFSGYEGVGPREYGYR